MLKTSLYKNVKKILIIFLVFHNTFISAQNFITKGTQKFPATKPWRFNCDACEADVFNSNKGYLVLQVAKNINNTGYLLLSTFSFSAAFESIKGIVYLYLDDGTIITCPDKGIRDHVDNTIKGLYVLSSKDLSLLKESNITKVRFSIYSNYVLNNFTAVNEYKTFDYIKVNLSEGFTQSLRVEKDATYDTATDISDLFSE